MVKSLAKSIALASLLAFNSALIGGAFPQSAQAESFSLLWSTNFNSLSSSNWNIYSNAAFGSSSNSCFMASNAAVQNGFLKLAINKSANGCNRPYSAAGLDTYFNHAQNYGRWEVSAKFPTQQGVTGYIGLFVADGLSWPPEIDFAEALGRDPQTVYLTQHYALNGSHQQDGIAVTQPGIDWSAGYHTYVVEWVPGQLRYYIDGILKLTQSQKFDAPPMQMKLAIGTGTGDCGGWVGCPVSSFDSDEMSIDYVNIYQYNP
ncbi:MAG: glycoside hydrolase family 16 protein [Anaerolineae bacterium]|nr:glycoside hydrolase family 16 protein [Gloeobacterales cyanobacterium ES-bin-313]